VADRSSTRKVPFIVGLLMLMVVSRLAKTSNRATLVDLTQATIVFFAGYSVTILIMSRCAQGVSSGLIWTTGFALCVDTEGSKHMGKILGIVNKPAASFVSLILSIQIRAFSSLFALGLDFCQYRRSVLSTDRRYCL
jgi:hypothetical protein